MKINIDKTIINIVLSLIVLKLIFSYLNVELGWWQRHLESNLDKFNILGAPDKIVKSFEFLIIPLLIIYVTLNLKRLKNMSVIVFIGALMIVLNTFTSFLNSKPLLNSYEYTLKLFSPILLFVCLVIHYRKHKFDFKKLLLRLIKLCVFLTLIAYIFFDESYNHDKTWLPIYFASVHTNSYVIVIIGIIVSYFLYIKQKHISFLIFSLCYLAFLFFGYRVRTPMVLYLVYVVFVSYATNNIFKAIWLKLLINIPIIIALFLIIRSDFDLNQYSSGRVVMYEAKYEMLKEYSVPEYLLGRGKGSDFIKTDYWIQEAKNSHNDFLTFLVENGIPYSFLFLSIIVLLILLKGTKINLVYSSLLIGYMLTSFLSNGLVLRPIASYLFFIVLSYIFINDEENRQVNLI